MKNLISLKELEDQIYFVEQLEVKLKSELVGKVFKPYPYKRAIYLTKTVGELITTRITKNYPEVSVKIFHQSCSGEVPSFIRISTLTSNDF